jgi:hypothetical protein
MSALQDDLPFRPRAMRFSRPVDAFTPPKRQRPRYGPESIEVPVPGPLRQYVRGPVHFALVLGALVAHAGHEGRDSYHGDRLECAQEVLRRFLRDLNDPAACDLLLLLFPPVACGQCGAPFLREGARREYCEDRCRRAAQYVMERARRAVTA